MTLKSILSELRLYICNEWVAKIPSHRLRNIYYRRVMGFKIGKGSTFFMHTFFDSAKGITIGENSVINSKCRLDSRGGVHIGSNVSISQEVIILTADHDPNSSYFEGRNNPIIIEDYVWIGTRATILPGIKIGKGSVVATGSIVTKNVMPFSIVAGIPAKYIKSRNSNLYYSASYKRLFQ